MMKTRTQRPTTVLQFGEGNFLRAFTNYFVDIANETGHFNGNVRIVKPIEYGDISAINAQDGVYNVLLRGKQDGHIVDTTRTITSVNGAVDPYTHYEEYIKAARYPELKIIISNTTEAGIVFDPTDKLEGTPPRSYPAKLTQFLYERFMHMGNDPNAGLVILPVELIEKNGEKLLACCLQQAALWELPPTFIDWLRTDNIFCNTLVDRIVTGYPKEDAEQLQAAWGYTDKLIVSGEPFALWVIESPRAEEVARLFPLDKAGLPVIYTHNLTPYRERKVRILNGAHTTIVAAAYLAGLDTVGQAMANTDIRALVEKAVYSEILPTVPLPTEQVRAFADEVFERFGNPFIRHKLLSISLNSVSKWRVRVLPSLKDILAATGRLPTCLSFSLAALAAFYRSSERGEGCLIGRRGGDAYEIRDDADVLDFFAAHAGDSADALARALLGNTRFWGEDLCAISGLADLVAAHLTNIESEGVAAVIREII